MAELCHNRLFRHFGELVGEGVDHKLEAIGNAELSIDRAEMMRDRDVTDKEPVGNLSVLESFRDQSDHLSLSIRQRSDLPRSRIDCRFLLAGHLKDQAS